MEFCGSLFQIQFPFISALKRTLSTNLLHQEPFFLVSITLEKINLSQCDQRSEKTFLFSTKFCEQEKEFCFVFLEIARCGITTAQSNMIHVIPIPIQHSSPDMLQMDLIQLNFHSLNVLTRLSRKEYRQGRYSKNKFGKQFVLQTNLTRTPPHSHTPVCRFFGKKDKFVGNNLVPFDHFRLSLNLQRPL